MYIYVVVALFLVSTVRNAGLYLNAFVIEVRGWTLRRLYLAIYLCMIQY